MNDFPTSKDFPAKDPDPYEERGKLYPLHGDRSPGRGVWIAATIILLVIVIALSGAVVFLLSRLNTAVISTPVTQNTPPTSTQAPTTIPTSQATIRALNLQLACQHCEQSNVIAFIKDYSSDSSDSTSITLTFTNHANSAVNMKVDTIKLLDQNGNPIPILSSDPYVGVAVGQTVPTTIKFGFTPQPGMKYTFSIVMEEADVFSNFYQSPAFSFA